MTDYKFTVTLHPWGENPERGNVGIDEAELYGYWEHKDGSEGGGLWFERLDNGQLDLIDYDGDYMLPRSVVAALRASGVSVDADFE